MGMVSTTSPPTRFFTGCINVFKAMNSEIRKAVRVKKLHVKVYNLTTKQFTYTKATLHAFYFSDHAGNEVEVSAIIPQKVCAVLRIRYLGSGKTFEISDEVFARDYKAKRLKPIPIGTKDKLTVPK
jgi:hypothetical protein